PIIPNDVIKRAFVYPFEGRADRIRDRAIITPRIEPKLLVCAARMCKLSTELECDPPVDRDAVSQQRFWFGFCFGHFFGIRWRKQAGECHQDKTKCPATNQATPLKWRV